jgi:hypothetical protein
VSSLAFWLALALIVPPNTCAYCRLVGMRSTVATSGFMTCTLLGTYAYYDEDGHYHYDDPNTCTESLRCSRGHEWTRTVRSSKP